METLLQRQDSLRQESKPSGDGNLTSPRDVLGDNAQFGLDGSVHQLTQRAAVEGTDVATRLQGCGW